MNKSLKPKRILIANRGEIVWRIAKSCSELGHIPVGVWTDNEYNARHLESCVEWLRLPGNKNSDTYLNIKNILRLVKDNNIDAVHPGYGFLSENANFAKELTKNNCVFIGPNENAIRIMGDKGTSKSLAEKYSIPVIPGTSSPVKNISEALKVAKDIGFPILIKAVAGGGGRGMRLCHNKKDIEDQFETAQREAESSFGNGDVLVEKFIERPRHIEVQILADKKGNIFHFFERECSIQRRHQKIIEEAPSPFIGQDEKLREDICNTAVKLARVVNYDSTGTVEFIMGADKSFYFLEMNTRLQVEHPITEAITGIDLVACMIQSAFGEDLGIPSQSWISRTGHSIECRICAEDPISLIPSPGKVIGFDTNFPQGIRFDHCIYRGMTVTPDFDPMIGKLVSKGIIRDVAIRKMAAALNGLHIEGIKTNIPLHKVIMKNKLFLKGLYDTNFLKSEKIADQINTDINYNHIMKLLAAVETRRMRI